MTDVPTAPKPQTRTFTESRKRGFAGKFFLLIFWGWNLLMIWWILAGIVKTAGPDYNSLPKDQQEAIAAGVGMAFMIQIFVWGLGSVVFGALAYFTRGKKIITEMIT